MWPEKQVLLGPPTRGHHSFNVVPESLIRCPLCATHWPQMHRSQRAAGQATGLVSSQAAEEKGTHSWLRPPASARDTGRRALPSHSYVLTSGFKKAA